MAHLCGQWELVSCDENFDKYMEAVGVSEEKRKLAQTALTAQSKLKQEISLEDGTTWSIKLITAAGQKIDVYPEGKPVASTTLDGRSVSVVYSREGDELIETQKGTGFESINTRKVSGDTMIMKFTANNGISSTRTYKKLS
uniref:Cytosolic fatty-acid binding proteins domain-containing protein n=1 Tax=Arion vulgaris TaxID=1028688 RepID=A0A0B6ZT97_9EUPU